MIKVKCSTPDTLCVTQMTPFQGDLKKRTAKDINELVASINTDGLLMPFAIWHNGDSNMILDGHGRFQAIMQIVMTQDATVLTQELPVLVIDAASEEEARKVLLQITSTYGKIKKEGVIKFASSVVSNAPVLKLATPKVSKVVKAAACNKKYIKLLVADDCYAKLLELLRNVDGVEVL
jgi:hypothetical protein